MSITEQAAESASERERAALPRSPQVHPLTLDFLAWLAAQPRSYTEAIDAWRTSCPRLSIWEDALADGLVAVERSNGIAPPREVVRLTDAGRELLVRNSDRR
jgi:hypothetical protein